MSRTLIAITATAALISGLAFTSCSDNAIVRTDPNAVRDLSGNWNATDSQETATAMIADVLARPWLDSFNKANNRQPVIKVGKVKNSTTEDIATGIFTDDIQRELLNSGKAIPVQSNGDVDEVRDERKDQAVNSAAETRKESFQETGADYLLKGEILVQHDQAGSEKQKFYSVNLWLVDIKTQRQVWIGNKKIAKDVNRAKYK